MVALVALWLLAAAVGASGAGSQVPISPNGIADAAKAKLSKPAVPDPPSELEARGVLPEGASWSDFSGLKASPGATPPTAGLFCPGPRSVAAPTRTHCTARPLTPDAPLSRGRGWLLTPWIGRQGRIPGRLWRDGAARGTRPRPALPQVFPELLARSRYHGCAHPRCSGA